DFDGDGLSEIMISVDNPDSLSDNGRIDALSERDWESLDISFDGTLFDLDIGSTLSGASQLLVTEQYQEGGISVKMVQHANDGTPAGVWLHHTLAHSETNGTLSAEMETVDGGQPVVYIADSANDAVLSMKAQGRLAIEYSLVSNGNIGSHPNMIIDNDENTHIFYLDETNSKLWYSTETSSGWDTEMITSQLTPSNMSLHSDGSEQYLIYQQDESVTVMVRSSWSETSEGIDAYASTIL
ncbi:uncharacterized protein METZ01_LOCUS488163, partial [marine metagenome]